MKHVLLLLVLSLAACSASESAAEGPRMGEGSEVGPGGAPLAPYPFTPEQIRDGFQNGTELVFRVSVKGQPPVMQRMQFRGHDQEGVTIYVRQESVEGIPMGDLMNERSTWKKLQEHAAFPAAGTVRLRERVETRAGQWDCWVYIVPGPEGSTTRFSFADDFPGPPILLEQSQDGEAIMRMELIERLDPGGDRPSHGPRGPR